MKPGYTYIITNKNHTTLYVGVTSELETRIKKHRNKTDSKSFTARYNLTKLVSVESFQMIEDAIGREKQLKAGSSKKKIEQIESVNPNWDDLFDRLNEFL